MGSPQVPLTQVRSNPVRFGVYEADLAAGELRRNGSKVRLQDLPFRALTLLLSRPGEVITREEFRNALWPADVFVDFEQGISSAMMRLRDALRDSAENPIFIETIERRGYRWIGPIQTPTQTPVAAPEPAPVEPPVQAKPERISAQTVIASAASSSSNSHNSQHSSIWRKLILAIPVLVLLFSVLTFRSGYRNAKANVKTNPAPAVHTHSPANREAEAFYLKGRFYWNKRTPESLHQAVEAFTQAIAHDPNYADAYDGLADCYNLLREFSVMPSNEAYLKAYAAAKKAAELDPQSAEAHASLAFVTFWGMWDARDAEAEFRRAIELAPNNAKAHHWFATFLNATGRRDEALSEIELAQKLDPHSSAILADQGEILRFAGHRDQALQMLKQLEASEPDFVSPHRYLSFAYFDEGDYPAYIAELRKLGALTHDPVISAEADAAAKGFAKGGMHNMLENQVQTEKKFYAQGKLSPCFVARGEAELADREESLKYLKICIEAHDEWALGVRHDPLWAGFHGDPTFEQLASIVDPPPAKP
jgi:DNA-binding winged helix-turn-helix (wHTH) protein/Tfp pilus assembly protein PilF